MSFVRIVLVYLSGKIQKNQRMMKMNPMEFAKADTDVLCATNRAKNF